MGTDHGLSPGESRCAREPHAPDLQPIPGPCRKRSVSSGKQSVESQSPTDVVAGQPVGAKTSPAEFDSLYALFTVTMVAFRNLSAHTQR